jgi:Ca2+-binding EF-hand superfamily protein
LISFFFAGVVDIDGDNQISFEEFWSAIIENKPTGMKNVMNGFMKQILHKQSSFQYSLLGVHQHAQAVQMFVATTDTSVPLLLKQNIQAHVPKLTVIGKTMAAFCLTQGKSTLTLTKPEAQQFLIANGIGQSVAPYLAKAMDKNNDGCFDFCEIAVAILMYEHGNIEMKAKLLFDSHDDDKDGNLGMFEMQSMVDSLMPGYPADTSQTVQRMYGSGGMPGEVDLDGDGKISFTEFFNAVVKDAPTGMGQLFQHFLARISDSQGVQTNQYGMQQPSEAFKELQKDSPNSYQNWFC